LTDLTLALTQAALNSQQTEAFVEAAGSVLSRRPLRAARLFVSMRALHPAFRARTYLWEQDTRHVRTVEWPHGLENRPGYYDSPDHLVHRTGSELRVRHPGATGKHTCDLYGTLRAQGCTDYLIVPLRLGDGTINTLSIATREPHGFRDRDLDWFREGAPLFTVVLERHAAVEALDAVLDAYLGRSVGRQILGGQIRAGDGELIDAAILMADLHDFTQHSARLEPAATVRLLNGYFDCLVGPISEHGGHLLKFIGDAVLAFFPILPGSAAPAPLEAVRAICRRLAALNAVRTAASQPPLRHALCLHYGQVLYGQRPARLHDRRRGGQPDGTGRRGSEGAWRRVPLHRRLCGSLWCGRLDLLGSPSAEVNSGADRNVHARRRSGAVTRRVCCSGAISSIRSADFGSGIWIRSG
jgi:adenylate cyclase